MQPHAKHTSLLAAALVSAALVAAPASAAVFVDDFTGDTNGLNYTAFVNGWTVADGTVDLIGTPPPFFDLVPGNGHYVDLDGSTGNAGVLTKSVNLLGGVLYTAQFSLAGSHRGDTNTVDVSFGSTLGSYTLLSADPFGVRTLLFTPGADGAYNLSFANLGGDNLGALLDNVIVEAAAAVVPEPSTWAMLLVGFGAAGYALRRRGVRAGLAR